jgi:ABC-2 type transport system permease protein
MSLFLLQLHGELWKLFGKKRTYLGFSVLATVQLAIVLKCYFDENAQRRILAVAGQEMFTSLTCAAVIILPTAFILLPLYVALVGGDLVAKEAEEGTLRMVLSRPIPRVRLILLKWIAGVVFAATLVAALGGFALGFSSLCFPWGGMHVLVPGEMFAMFDAAEGFHRYLGAHVLMAGKAATLLTLAFMFSCFNMRPAAATVLAISIVFGDRLLSELPQFAEVRHWFMATHLNTWRLYLQDPIPWWRIISSNCLLAAFNITFLAIGMVVFQVRDIKS